jgi:hypothetical protein
MQHDMSIDCKIAFWVWLLRILSLTLCSFKHHLRIHHLFLWRCRCSKACRFCWSSVITWYGSLNPCPHLTEYLPLTFTKHRSFTVNDFVLRLHFLSNLLFSYVAFFLMLLMSALSRWIVWNKHYGIFYVFFPPQSGKYNTVFLSKDAT